MNEPFEQKDYKRNKKSPILIVGAAVLILGLAAVAGIRFGLPALEKWRDGDQQEAASENASVSSGPVAILGTESEPGAAATAEPTIQLPGIKTEEEAAEESAATESGVPEGTAQTPAVPNQTLPGTTAASGEEMPAAAATATPAAAFTPVTPAPESAAAEAPASEAPAAEAPAQAAPAADDLESMKSFLAGYWECELTNEEKPYLYLYFSPDFSYKMGFKSDQKLTTDEIAKSFKQEITSVRMEDGWVYIDAFFIDGDLHTVSVKRDEAVEDGIIYHRITGTDSHLTRMKED